MVAFPRLRAFGTPQLNVLGTAWHREPDRFHRRLARANVQLEFGEVAYEGPLVVDDGNLGAHDPLSVAQIREADDVDVGLNNRNLHRLGECRTDGDQSATNVEVWRQRKPDQHRGQGGHPFHMKGLHEFSALEQDGWPPIAQGVHQWSARGLVR